jgi:hypothetical protein
MASVTADSRFVCAPDVAAKVIDGEAIIINLANGIYYGADHVGGVVWSLLEAGRSIAEVTAHVAACYDVSAEQVHADVMRMISRLLEEQLVQEASTRSGDSIFIPPSSAGAPYVPPELHVYRDMGDLLALDPPMPILSRNPWEDPESGTR